MNIKKVFLCVLMIFTFTSAVAFGQGTTKLTVTQAYKDAAINKYWLLLITLIIPITA